MGRTQVGFLRNLYDWMAALGGHSIAHFLDFLDSSTFS